MTGAINRVSTHLNHLMPSGITTFRVSRPNLQWLRADYQSTIPYSNYKKHHSIGLNYPHSPSELLEYPALRMIKDYKYECKNLESFSRQKLVYPTRGDNGEVNDKRKLIKESINYESCLGPELWIIIEGEGVITYSLGEFNEGFVAVGPGSFVEIPKGASFCFHDLERKDPVRAVRVFQSSSDPRHDGCVVM